MQPQPLTPSRLHAGICEVLPQQMSCKPDHLLSFCRVCPGHGVLRTLFRRITVPQEEAVLQACVTKSRINVIVASWTQLPVRGDAAMSMHPMQHWSQWHYACLVPTCQT